MTEESQDKAEPEIPEWAMAPVWRCHRRLREESRYLHLSLYGLSIVAERPHLYEEATRDMCERDNVDPHRAEHFLKRAKEDARWVESESKLDFPILFAHASVALWGILEVLCEDILIAWLQNRPDAWAAKDLVKVKVPIAQYESRSPGERVRLVLTELERVVSAEARSGFARLCALLAVFNLLPALGPNMRRSLHELCQVRHVIVHSNAVADTRFLEQCPWVPLRPGEPVVVSHDLFSWYLRAAEAFTGGAGHAVMTAFGADLSACRCADDVYIRPDGRPSPTNAA